MRRVLTLAVSFSLVCVLGCGNRYQQRTDKTIEKLRYAKRLDDNLNPAPTDGKLKEISIYVRPPKGMERAKAFQLTAVPPGQFDAEESFIEGAKSSLHILARQKTAKKPTAKGAAPVEAAPRGEFSADVRNILGTFFNDPDALDPSKSKDSRHKGNSFRRTVFKANNKNVEVYLYKADPYDAVLVFIVDPADAAAMASKIQLCLESFAAGSAAKSKYDSGGSEDEGAEGGVAAF